MTSYWEKLKDPRWQKKRLEVLDKHKWKCASCSDETTTLHVHHVRYKKGCEPWEYNDSDLTVLCENCHEDVTHCKEFIGALLGWMKPEDRHALHAIARVIYSFNLKAQPKIANSDEHNNICRFVAAGIFAKTGQQVSVDAIRDAMSCGRLTRDALTALTTKPAFEPAFDEWNQS